MYIVPQEDIEILLIGNDDSTSKYENYDEFIKSTSYYFIERYIVNRFSDAVSNWLWLYTRKEDTRTKYVVRDKFGGVYTRNEILHDKKEHNGKYFGSLRLRFFGRHDYVYRYDPVPHTGKCKWRFSKWYKKPRTTQEARWSEAHAGYVRGKRRKNYLPNSWDDYPRGDGFIKRSWKKNKKKRQWA